VGKRLQLNDAGRDLLPAALALLDGAHAIESRSHADAGAAALIVGASTTIGNYLLPRLFARYRESHPGVALTLNIANTRDVVTAVQVFAADLGFIEGPCHVAEVTVLPWLEDELVIVAAPTHRLARAAALGVLTMQQLMAALWLLREPGSGTRAAVEQALAPHLPNLPATLILGSSEAIKNAAAEALGVACLSRAVVADLVTAGRLVVLATQLPRLRRRFSIIHHRHKSFSRALRSFLTYCEGVGADP
jgi:DNA-binding transcriptional LysR family regulator